MHRTNKVAVHHSLRQFAWVRAFKRRHLSLHMDCELSAWGMSHETVQRKLIVLKIHYKPIGQRSEKSSLCFISKMSRYR